jgi:hypothetical protein
MAALARVATSDRRPSEADVRLDLAIPTPRSPSYPCEYSVTAGAGATILVHLFPKDAARFAKAAEEAARSRVQAGVVYPSDTQAGLELGRRVVGRVIDAMKLDGQKWAGTIPVSPGLWQGTNPVGIDEVRWKLFVLSSASQSATHPLGQVIVTGTDAPDLTAYGVRFENGLPSVPPIIENNDFGSADPVQP